MGVLSKTTSEIEDALEKAGNIEATFDTMFTQKILSIYPVGAIYMSASSTSPASLFGGTWEQIQDRFLLAAGSSYTVGDTGGASTVTLTESQMPVHNHTVNISTSGTGLSTTNRVYWNEGLGSADKNAWGFGYTSSDLPSGSTGVSAVNTGGGEAHTNMPPYLVVYMWKRIE